MTISVFPGSIPELDIQLDSPEWFKWLATQSQFKYEGNLTTMSVKRRTSNGKWYARKKVYSSDKGSIPIDLYIGADEECTSEKLKEINYRFGQDWRDFWPWYHSPDRKEPKAKGVQREKVYTEAQPSSQTRNEADELRARLVELEKENEELERKLKAANELNVQQSREISQLDGKLADALLKLESTQGAFEREAAPLKILDGWIEANQIDLKPRTADKLRAYREYLLRSSREARSD
jgi:hypothetical protein